MWEAVDKMTELGIPPSTYTYSLIISRFLSNENLELALQFLFHMKARGLVPELKAAQGVILLAARLGYPRLALDLAASFEEGSVRKLDPEVWMNCLIASAQDLYVSVNSYQSMVEGLCHNISTSGRWCHSMLGHDSSSAKYFTCRRNLH